MSLRLNPSRRFVPVALGVVTLGDAGVLIAQDVFPGFLPRMSHGCLEAASLALIAVAYLIYQALHRPPLLEWAKAILLAAAFLFWAANQLWPSLPQATLFNDIAIGLFVFDVFLVMAGWPASEGDTSFAETGED